jgi:hypothetical protein
MRVTPAPRVIHEDQLQGPSGTTLHRCSVPSVMWQCRTEPAHVLPWTSVISGWLGILTSWTCYAQLLHCAALKYRRVWRHQVRTPGRYPPPPAKTGSHCAAQVGLALSSFLPLPECWAHKCGHCAWLRVHHFHLLCHRVSLCTDPICCCW